MDFDLAFDRLIGNEGGYTNGKGDPGGETNWGISKRAYPDIDIKSLTREAAKAIYKRDYWDKLPPLDPNVAYHVFDFAVNSGVGVALHILSRETAGPPETLILRLCAARLEFMTTLRNWPQASRGWTKRVATNLRFASHDLSQTT